MNVQTFREKWKGRTRACQGRSDRDIVLINIDSLNISKIQQVRKERRRSGSNVAAKEQDGVREWQQGRSGEQLDIWSAGFGPVGVDGYFKPLFDKETGVIDRSVTRYRKEHWDMRYYLEAHWKESNGVLRGNTLHGEVRVGRSKTLL